MERWEKVDDLSRVSNSFCFKKHKDQLIKRERNICQQCHKLIIGKCCTLDHKIPCKIGGSDVIFHKDNLWLLCSKCDKVKTKKDITIILEMKKKGFFITDEGYHVFLKPEKECVGYYLKRFKELNNI